MELSPAQRKCLKDLGVVALYLFGSRAQGREGPLSDYDYAVLMNRKGHQRGSDLYFNLLEILDPASPRSYPNDIIDIIFLQDVGLELKFHVIRYGVVLFDDDPRFRLNFESETMLLYCDFRPLLNQFDQTILEAL